jgi:hypothetical protein
MRHTLFKEGDFWNRTKWSFKPHAETPFWKWVVSWARGVRRPSDIGFDDARFVLPPINYNYHVVESPYIPAGELFPRPAITLREQREEVRRTIPERCDRVAELVAHDRPAIVWCHYNEEGNRLEKLIPGAVQISGSDDIDVKEQRLTDFAFGRSRVLVTKPKIGCWGLNLQHCGDMTFFPSYSYEGFYQGVRRCWRFGRQGPVNVEIVSAEGESKVIQGLRNKADQADRMFASLVRHMTEATYMQSGDRHHSPIVFPDFISPIIHQQELSLCQ